MFIRNLFTRQIDVSSLPDEEYAKYLDERYEKACERLAARERKAEKLDKKEHVKLRNFRKG